MKTIEQTQCLSEQDRALLQEIKELIREVVPSAEVLLYGSVAKGTRGPESDYDLLILTDEPLAEDTRERAERRFLEMELAHDVILSTIYHSKAEWRRRETLPFHTEVEKHGIKL